MTDEWPEITYRQALAAYDAGQKLHVGNRIFLVRRALSSSQRLDQPTAQPPHAHAPTAKPVLWVVDELTTGDHGLLLYPDGQMMYKHASASDSRPISV